MTKREMQQIWTILGMYRPKDRRLKDKELKELWWLTFEPYSLEAVRAAVVAHFREKPRYFPNIPEILTRCPLPGEEIDQGAGQSTKEADQRARADMERMRKYLEELRAAGS